MDYGERKEMIIFPSPAPPVAPPTSWEEVVMAVTMARTTTAPTPRTDARPACPQTLASMSPGILSAQPYWHRPPLSCRATFKEDRYKWCGPCRAHRRGGCELKRTSDEADSMHGNLARYHASATSPGTAPEGYRQPAVDQSQQGARIPQLPAACRTLFKQDMSKWCDACRSHKKGGCALRKRACDEANALHGVLGHRHASATTPGTSPQGFRQPAADQSRQSTRMHPLPAACRTLFKQDMSKWCDACRSHKKGGCELRKRACDEVNALHGVLGHRHAPTTSPGTYPEGHCQPAVDLSKQSTLPSACRTRFKHDMSRWCEVCCSHKRGGCEFRRRARDEADAIQGTPAPATSGSSPEGHRQSAVDQSQQGACIPELPAACRTRFKKEMARWCEACRTHKRGGCEFRKPTLPIPPMPQSLDEALPGTQLLWSPGSQRPAPFGDVATVGSCFEPTRRRDNAEPMVEASGSFDMESGVFYGVSPPRQR